MSEENNGRPTLNLIWTELVEIRKELKVITRLDSELQGMRASADRANSAQIEWNRKADERFAKIESKLPLMEMFTGLWQKGMIFIFGVIVVALLLAAVPQIGAAIKIVGGH